MTDCKSVITLKAQSLVMGTYSSHDVHLNAVMHLC